MHTKDFAPASAAIESAGLAPEPGSILVYRVALGAEHTGLAEGLVGLLTPDERSRAESFRHDAEWRRFVLMRGTLRRLLGRSTHVAPEVLVFAYGPQGKPSLAGSSLEFNVSHSGDEGAIVVSAGVPLGVDVEAIDPSIDLADLTDIVLTPRERAIFDGLPSRRRHRFFFDRWVCKEAVLKATGCGLSMPPDKVEVRAGFAEVHPSRDGHDPAQHFSLHRFSVTRGYTAALAVVTGPLSVRHRRLQPAAGSFTATDHSHAIAPIARLHRFPGAAPACAFLL